MPYMRFLFRNVYSEQHELSDRSCLVWDFAETEQSRPYILKESSLAKHAGMQVMELLEKNIRPRDIMTKEAFLNALTVDMALGCSTNSMLHLPAIAHEIGMDFEIDFANGN